MVILQSSTDWLLLTPNSTDWLLLTQNSTDWLLLTQNSTDWLLLTWVYLGPCQTSMIKLTVTGASDQVPCSNTT